MSDERTGWEVNEWLDDEPPRAQWSIWLENESGMVVDHLGGIDLWDFRDHDADPSLHPWPSDSTVQQANDQLVALIRASGDDIVLEDLHEEILDILHDFFGTSAGSDEGVDAELRLWEWYARHGDYEQGQRVRDIDVKGDLL